MNILFIGAHFDDIEIAAGGTVKKLSSSKENNIKALICCNSSYNNIEGKIQRSIDTAKSEGLKALNFLGISDIEILNYESKFIPFNSNLIEDIEKCLIKFKPDLIFTHHPYDIHQDHQNVAKSTCAAARNYNNIYFYEPFGRSGRSYTIFKPTTYINIDDFIEDKIMSLKMHKSEYEKYGKNYWTDAIKSRCLLRGYEINYKYAECFEVFREVIL